jgi:ribosomal protein L7/L12
MIYSIAIGFTDSRGNDKVRAFGMDAESDTDALGQAFTMLAASSLSFTVNDWDIAPCLDAQLEAIRPEIMAGRKIGAIKALRDVHHLGLQEAKVFVEKYWDEWRCGDE